MYAVIMIHTFDSDTPTVVFDDYEKAKAYLHWLWEDYYNTEHMTLRAFWNIHGPGCNEHLLVHKL